MVADTNPILDYLRDGDDDYDPWGSAMLVLGALLDVNGCGLEHGEEVIGDLCFERETILEALGFGIKGPADDGPYTWPTLTETTAYDPAIRQAWLDHATAVYERRESFARLMGRSY